MAAVPKQTALEAFAYDYQVDIPGVTVPKGIEGGDEPVDGSGPLSWVEANWDQLTAGPADRHRSLSRPWPGQPDDHPEPDGDGRTHGRRHAARCPACGRQRAVPHPH